MAKDYIPRSINQFFIFQQTLANAVSSNAIAWGIPAGQVTAFADDSVKYTALYKAISNKANRTGKQVKDHADFRVQFEKGIRALINGYLRNNAAIGNSQKTVLGIKVPARRRKQRSPITDSLMLAAIPKAGARMLFKCRVPSSEGKPHLHTEAQGVELRYCIGTEPATINQTTHSYISIKASFTIQFDLEHRGKTVFVFARWKNLTNDSNSGPWCDLVREILY